MPIPGTITVWIAELKAGDKRAAQRLWENYFARLVELARQRLLSAPRSMADEEDAALSAFHSFFRGVKENRFPRLERRDDLWQLLVLLTARKAFRMMKHELRERGGGRSRQLSAFDDEETARHKSLDVNRHRVRCAGRRGVPLASEGRGDRRTAHRGGSQDGGLCNADRATVGGGGTNGGTSLARIRRRWMKPED